MVKCQHCRMPLEVAYSKIGDVVVCPVCGGVTALAYEMGSRIPLSGYHIRFSDFKQLLADADYRREIAPLLEGWLGCRVVAMDASVALLKPSGEYLILSFVHEQIQSDPVRREALYQKAMNLWR